MRLKTHIDNFNELYKVGRQEKAIVNLSCFRGVVLISMQEIENSVNMLKNEKAAGIEKTREISKNGDGCD